MSVRPEHPTATTLAALVTLLPGLRTTGDLRTPVTGVTLSSRRVHPGDLYAALPGARVHGIDFAAAALAAGAVAVLTDPDGAARAPGGVPLLVAERPRELLGRVAAAIHGEPAASMAMIGVTGTQGKTTTTRLAEAGLSGAGVTAAAVGTVGTRIAGRDVKTDLTTPEAPDLHALFALMRERGVAACAMEVSSHALVMGRVDGVVFDVAVFLNLGRDHLDFHADVEDYYAAKASLFTRGRTRRALVNLDDDHGRRLVRELRDVGEVPVTTFSLEPPTDSSPHADWWVDDVVAAPDGSTFTVHGPHGLTVVAGCPLPGRFNVSNTLAAIAACATAGVPAGPGGPELVAAAIARGPGVPGRLERVEAGQDFVAVVDYAHKPDAVQAALDTLRPLTAGRVIVVIGAGGDRDPGKRPLMGQIAARLADVVIITDDNPRTEDPAAIRRAVLAGAAEVTGGADVVEIGDRGAAIADGCHRARPGDILLVAGKGHETGQEVAGVIHPFDDREILRRLLTAGRLGASWPVGNNAAADLMGVVPTPPRET